MTDDGAGGRPFQLGLDNWAAQLVDAPLPVAWAHARDPSIRNAPVDAVDDLRSSKIAISEGSAALSAVCSSETVITSTGDPPERAADRRRMERDGFIEYADNPHHKRAKLIVLTAKGRQALRQMEARQVTWANRIGAGVDEQHLRSALDGLRLTRQRLDEDTAVVPDGRNRRSEHA